MGSESVVSEYYFYWSSCMFVLIYIETFFRRNAWLRFQNFVESVVCRRDESHISLCVTEKNLLYILSRDIDIYTQSPNMLYTHMINISTIMVDTHRIIHRW